VRGNGKKRKGRKGPRVSGHEDIVEMNNEGMTMLAKKFHFMKESFFIRFMLEQKGLGSIPRERGDENEGRVQEKGGGRRVQFIIFPILD
jgi:hypothetical protein